MLMSRLTQGVLTVCVLGLACIVLAAERRLPVSADTNISSHPSEQNRNFGRSPRIRIKGIEMLMLVKFDTTPIRDWKTERASLFLHAAGPHRLKTIGVSTIATDWVEGDGQNSEATGGATFTWADFGKRRWGGPQSDFTDAALTAQNTWVHYTDLKEHENGWLEIEIPPRFVHALIVENSFGLAITDEKGQTRWNNDVHSREQSGFAPYLIVVGNPSDNPRVSKRAAVPPPAAPSAKPRPTLEKVEPVYWSGGEPPMRDGKLRVWAYGDCEKAHPISGNLLEEVGAEKYGGPSAGHYRKRNAVWDGASSTIRLTAARNEFVAFHLCIEALRPCADIRVVPSALTESGGGTIAAVNVTVFKDWYVRDGEWFPEVAVPLTGAFTIPDKRNGISGQRNQSLFVDVYVPHAVKPGNYKGKIRISAEDVVPFEISMQLHVLNFVLPDTLSFDVDLNAYGPPGDADMELKFHRLAHTHRATLNILAYSHSGRIHAGYVPPLEGTGKNIRVKDWTEFDHRHGRYFDGSAFSDLPRKGVPLDHAYLPFFEGWPSDIRQHYRYRATTTAYPDCIIEHAMKAPPIEEAFDEQFKEEFKAIASQFAAHFVEKGWTRTQFQFYMNNKYYYRDPKQGGRGISWWLLDEPMHRDDWLALRFFGQMFKDALKQGPRPNFIFRADVSRPQWQRDWLNGLVDLMCVSRAFFEKNARCMEMRRSQGVRFWHYGTGNDIRLSNLTGVAWGIKVFLAGGDGFLPWNSLGDESSFDRPTPTALLYPGKRFGINGPLASLRLKAFRRSQQDVEYLILLAEKMGWDHAQLVGAISPFVRLDARTRESFVEDAGQTLFDGLTSDDFARLRASLAVALSK